MTAQNLLKFKLNKIYSMERVKTNTFQFLTEKQFKMYRCPDSEFIFFKEMNREKCPMFQYFPL